MSVLDPVGPSPTSSGVADGGPTGSSAPVTAAVPSAPAGALAFSCGNCALDWPEPFCDFCGADLNNERAHALTLPGAGVRSEGV